MFLLSSHAHCNLHGTERVKVILSFSEDFSGLICFVCPEIVALSFIYIRVRFRGKRSCH